MSDNPLLDFSDEHGNGLEISKAHSGELEVVVGSSSHAYTHWLSREQEHQLFALLQERKAKRAQLEPIILDGEGVAWTSVSDKLTLFVGKPGSDLYSISLSSELEDKLLLALQKQKAKRSEVCIHLPTSGVALYYQEGNRIYQRQGDRVLMVGDPPTTEMEIAVLDVLFGVDAKHYQLHCTKSYQNGIVYWHGGDTYPIPHGTVLDCLQSDLLGFLSHFEPRDMESRVLYYRLMGRINELIKVEVPLETPLEEGEGEGVQS